MIFAPEKKSKSTDLWKEDRRKEYFKLKTYKDRPETQAMKPSYLDLKARGSKNLIVLE